jgi:hypothetical protein
MGAPRRKGRNKDVKDGRDSKDEARNAVYRAKIYRL